MDHTSQGPATSSHPPEKADSGPASGRTTLRVLTVGPVPPEYGGADTGGVHATIIDLYSHLPADIRSAILVTNPPLSALHPPPALTRLFSEASYPPPYRGLAGKVRAVLTNMHRLRPFEVLGAVVLAVTRSFSPLRVLYHAAALRRAIEVHRPDLLHVHMIDLPAAYALLVRRDLPLWVTIHSFNVMKSDSPAQNRRYRRLIAGNLRRLRRAVAVSSFVRHEAEETFGFRGCVVLPNSVDTREFTPRDVQDDDAPKLLFTGNLIPRKSVDVLLRAVAILDGRFPGLSLTVVGDGADRSRLRALAAELGIEDRVAFPGRWSRDELRERLPRFQIFVMPSAHEGLSISMLEAMSAGLCVIAGRPASGSYDAPVDGRTGLYYSHPDPADLAEKIARVAGDPAFRRRLRDAARTDMVERFDIRSLAEHMADLFRETVTFAGGEQAP
jgi:glycosyltransferase involved in cell wall biosynthesis